MVKEVLRIAEEFKLPVFMLFIDYFKAFDALKIGSVFQALEEQEVDTKYIQLLKNIYKDGKLKLFNSEVLVRRGVRQGDPDSPKYFNAALESIFQRLNWSIKGERETPSPLEVC